MSGEDLKGVAARGLAWTAFEKVAQQVIQFVIGVVIARILSPEDFGVVGMTAIFMAVANTVVDSGFGSALIQKRERGESDYATCFYVNVGLGLVMYGVMWIAAPWIAEFYRSEILEDVVRVLGLSFVVNSLCIAQNARMTAEMRFREMSVITVVAQLSTGVVGLVMAFMGCGVWALVFQQLAGCVVRLVGVEVYLRWWPKGGWSWESFRGLFGFGSKILCSSLINTVYNNLYTLVIGRVFSAGDVGYYNRANQFAELPSNSLLQVVMKVAYPLMAKVQDDVERLRAAYRKFLDLPMFVLSPVLVGMAVLAEPLVLVLLGEKWLMAVPLLRVLCVGAIFSPLTHINLNILYVKGRTDLVLRLELIKKPIGFLILFVSMGWGLWWLCAGRALYCLVAYAFNCYYTGKFIGLGFWRQMGLCLPIWGRAVVMGVACWVCVVLFEGAWEQLVVGTVVGAVVYVGMAVVMRDEVLGDLVGFVRGRFMKNKGE